MTRCCDPGASVAIRRAAGAVTSSPVQSHPSSPGLTRRSIPQRPCAGNQSVAPGTRMNFDCGRAKLRRGPDLLRIGSDEQGYRDSRSAELGYDRLNGAALLDDIEAAFGRTLLAPLRNEARRMRPRFDGDAQHFFRGGHFQIERFWDFGLEPRDIVVANVAAIFAQMRRDAIGSSRDCGVRGSDRIGVAPAPRIPKRSHVIDIHPKAQMSVSGQCLPRTFTPARAQADPS